MKKIFSKLLLVTILMLPISFTSFAISPIIGDSSVCKGNTITLSNATSGGTWSSSNVAIAMVGSSTGNVIGVAAGVVIITYAVDTSFVTKTVTINPLPVITISGHDSICDGAVDTLIAHTSASIVSWLPSADLSCAICDTVLASPLIPHSTTLYYVIATDINGCIDTSFAFPVTVNPLPLISVSPYPATVCLDSSIQLHAGGAATYLWSPDTGLSCDSCANPVISITSNAAYYVKGTTALGCVDSFFVLVAVDSTCTTGVPLLNNNSNEVNIFPNPTATYLIITSTHAINTITINNLLGQKVYSNQYNNAEQVHVDVIDFPSGVYFIKVNDSEVKKFVKE